MEEVVKRLTDLYLNNKILTKDLFKLVAEIETNIEPISLRDSQIAKGIEYWQSQYMNNINTQELFETIAIFGAVDDDKHVYTCSGEICEYTHGTFNEAFLELTTHNADGVVLKHEPFGNDEEPKIEITIFSQ